MLCFYCVFQSQVANAMVASIYQQELAKMTDKSAGSSSGLAGKLSSPYAAAAAAAAAAAVSHEHSSGAQQAAARRKSSHHAQQQQDTTLTAEMVMRIHQEELQKLCSAAERSGNLAECQRYRQELQRLAFQMHQQQQPHREENKENVMMVKQEPDGRSEDGGSRQNGEGGEDMPQDLSMGTQNGGDSTQQEDEGDSVESDSMRHAGSAFFLVRPRSAASAGSPAEFPATSSAAAVAAAAAAGVTTADGLSPLQRMQSIANSLMAKSQLQNQQQNRPPRAVLPPITQEDFDKHPNINTDELVKQVKENLSQFSISQRLFGENVLGLSQGSVSDLL